MPQTQIHQQITKAARTVVINHPNSYEVVWLKPKNPMVTINGIRQLGTPFEDNPDDLEYENRGSAYMLIIDGYQPSPVVNNGLTVDDVRESLIALIEPKDFGEVISKGDIFSIVYEDDDIISFEVVDIEMPVGLPNSMNAFRYILNKKDELIFLDNEETDQDDVELEDFVITPEQFMELSEDQQGALNALEELKLLGGISDKDYIKSKHAIVNG